MTPADFDDLLDRELKRLPYPAAPATLLPRVLTAIAEQARVPWYQRAWLTWPVGLRAASILAFAAFLVAVVLAMSGAQQATDELVGLLDVHASTRVIAMLRVGRGTATLMRISWEVVLQPVATYVAVLMLAVSLGCAGVWTVLNRVALGGASHQ